ncbi:MAG: hypothetical protein Q4G50_07445 [Corynebacterium sp.]|uniref:hypothetical protein n=1 Tax=Corynebacterium sp. TaxID=1720 RepID=UPI0026DF099A|nr:hypothetical protein [Corynebacterium sp.]MDO5669822.1 hypothetical protein [Corynebacterium sp.]
MTYDWGIPQSQPAPEKKRRRGLIAVLALIVVIIVAAITFLVLPTMLRMPAGLSASQMRGAFQDGQLTDCDLGEDFYRTAGITNLSTSDEGCEGIIDDGEKQARVLIVVEELKVIELLDATPTDPELTLWKQGRAPLLTQATAESDMCTLATTDGLLRGVNIQTDANCEALYPLARQLINAARWFQSQEGFGRFNPFAAPDYLDIPEPVITSTLAQRDSEDFYVWPDSAPYATSRWWTVELDGVLQCSLGTDPDPQTIDQFSCFYLGISEPDMVEVEESHGGGFHPANFIKYEAGSGFSQGALALGHYDDHPPLLQSGETLTVGDVVFEHFPDGEFRVTSGEDSFSVIDRKLTINNS